MGRLVIALPILPGCSTQERKPDTIHLEKLPGGLRRASTINAWLEVLENGMVRIFSGKVELGQGIRIAIQQVAADELYMDLDRVEVVLAETGLTPNEGYTAGSGSIQNSAMSVRYAAAAAREKLLELAAKKLQTQVDQLKLVNGFIQSKNAKQRLSFAQLLEGQQLQDEVPLTLKLKPKSEYQYVGKAIKRGDLQKMVKGEALYIHDLKFPGMVHARVLRPLNYQSKLLTFDRTAFEKEANGILKISRNGNFLGVITEKEYQAEKAIQFLRTHSKWSKPAIFPAQKELKKHIKANVGESEVAFGKETSINIESAEVVLKANYFKPYTMHGAMGPACAIAKFDGKILTIWSHSQGIYPMRAAIAAMLEMEEENIHIISSPGSGCFGHTVADDAAADAALLAVSYPNKHIRVRWSRADEHQWEPYGSAMIMELEAGLNSNGKISFWRSTIWTDSHSTRPNKDPGTLLAARHLATPFKMKGRGYLRGGHRNSDPYYDIPQLQVQAHYFDGPLRVSSLRSLGAFANIFAIESFMDELAEKIGLDSLTFRINHSKDQRAIDVLQKVKELTSALTPAKDEGLGFAFCRYKNSASYCALAAQVKVNLNNSTVQLIKMWAAVDVGEVINLDGIKNQVEGAIVQAAAWTITEEVKFNTYEITSTDWSSYPILQFEDTPEIEVAILDRPNEPAIGGGEVGTPPIAAAICNAIYKASGQRIYDLPVRINKT